MGIFDKAKEAVGKAADSVKNSVGNFLPGGRKVETDEPNEPAGTDIRSVDELESDIQQEPAEPSPDSGIQIDGLNPVDIVVADDDAENGVRTVTAPDAPTAQHAYQQAALTQENAKRKPVETVEIDGEEFTPEEIGEGIQRARDKGLEILDYRN